MEQDTSPPILITGAARSGTSLVAGAIHRCGAFGGGMFGPNKSNEKGMYENRRIRNTVVKPYLRSLGLDDKCQYPLPDPNSISIPTDWHERIRMVLQDEGYSGGPWFYKGPKMPHMWPVWAHAFPNARWIVVRRKSSDIANSCLKTGFMRAFRNKSVQEKIGVDNEYDGWIWWIRQHEERFREMINAGLNCKIVWPERMVSGDYTQLMEAIEWAGLEWSTDVIRFIDPKLWKARKR